MALTSGFPRITSDFASTTVLVGFGSLIFGWFATTFPPLSLVPVISRPLQGGADHPLHVPAAAGQFRLGRLVGVPLRP